MSDFDTTAQPFKVWLVTRLKRNSRDDIDRLTHKLIADKAMPRSGSLALYRAHMRSKGFSMAEQEAFEQAWTEMKQSSNQADTEQT